MRILVLGAGAVGGYFGAQLARSKANVTFLVRPQRAAQLAERGLSISSPLGDARVKPKFITEIGQQQTGRYDIVILACKAYDLQVAADAVRPALSPQGLLLPLLNGIAHLDYLDSLFGQDRVLGGVAHLGLTLDSDGTILHLNEINQLFIGARIPGENSLLNAFADLLSLTDLDFSLSADIENEMWDKFIFITALAGATCTMRCPVGTLLKTTYGRNFTLALLSEAVEIAEKCGHKPNQERLCGYKNHLTSEGSTSTASMLRDINAGARTEVEQVFGDIVKRANCHGLEIPSIRTAYTHLQAYEICRTDHRRD